MFRSLCRVFLCAGRYPHLSGNLLVTGDFQSPVSTQAPLSGALSLSGWDTDWTLVLSHCSEPMSFHVHPELLDPGLGEGGNVTNSSLAYLHRGWWPLVSPTM
jgi:hypothetical protein